MRISDDGGHLLNAEYSVESEGDHLALILESAGGRTRPGESRNTDYRAALMLLLTRLRERDAEVLEALVDSRVVMGLPERERRLVDRPIRLTDESDMQALRQRLTSAQGRIGQAPGTRKAGNNSKRLRLRLTVPGYGLHDADRLARALSTAAGSGAEGQPAEPPAARPETAPGAGRTPSPGQPPAPARPRPRPTRQGLFAGLEQLAVHTQGGVPSRHKPLALLWAIGQVATGQSRLIEWRDFRAGMTPILQRYGRPESCVSPEHPFWHLRSSGLWEVVGLDGHPTKTPRLALLDQENPPAGLTIDAAGLLKDPAVRGRAVRTLLTRYLADVDHAALLADVGLPGYDSATGAMEIERQLVIVDGEHGQTSRREATTQRIMRDPQVAQSVKALHDHRCQVCGMRLQTRNGGYSEAAHIRGLGAPHDGPDHLMNLLCLCPNDHVLFDTFTIYVDREGIVRFAEDQSPIGVLRRHPRHDINPEHLSYHRQLCGYDE